MFVFQKVKHYHISVLRESSKNHAGETGIDIYNSRVTEGKIFKKPGGMLGWVQGKDKEICLLEICLSHKSAGNIATLQNELFLFLKL